MKFTITALLIVALIAGSAVAKINVVTSTSDLKSIAEYIGGDLISVQSIASGKSNPHFVEVLPSYMVMVSRADVYFKIGLGLDFWAQPIIDGSRNGKVKIFDCSKGINVLEKPGGKVDASMGDVHPEGNPHYWLDPGNAEVIAQNIADGLSEVDPGNSTNYSSNLTKFKSELKSKMSEWQLKAAPLKGLEIITFHESWPYFSEAFGLDVIGYIEPKPGIEPTPSHTAELIELVKRKGVKIIAKEPYFSDRSPNVIAKATGARVINLPPSVGGETEARDYFSLIDTIIGRLIAGMENQTP